MIPGTLGFRLLRKPAARASHATDRCGLSLATASAAARDAYIEGCDLALTFYPGAAARSPPTPVSRWPTPARR
jgi:hypothetical protein